MWDRTLHLLAKVDQKSKFIRTAATAKRPAVFVRSIRIYFCSSFSFCRRAERGLRERGQLLSSSLGTSPRTSIDVSPSIPPHSFTWPFQCIKWFRLVVSHPFSARDWDGCSGNTIGKWLCWTNISLSPQTPPAFICRSMVPLPTSFPVSD